MTDMCEDPPFTPRFDDALVYAARLHAMQHRKGGRIPYVSHLLSVAALVMEDGGDEDEAIAGLLHDAVEDQGGLPTLEAIRSKFGNRVADIVHGCSDSEIVPKPPWRERKERYVEHMRRADPSILRVSLADKLHNLRAILLDYRQLGEALWTRFNAPREQTVWYYRELLQTFQTRSTSPMVGELERTLDTLQSILTSSLTLATEGGRFDEDTFTAALRDHGGGQSANGFARLLPWSRTTFEWVYWGTGKTTPTFLGGLNHGPGSKRFLNFFAVWPDGSLYIELRFLRNFAPFDRAERRERLRERLAKMPGVELSSAPWRPSFDVAILTDDRAWAAFTGIVEDAVLELRDARDGPSSRGTEQAERRANAIR